jgi:predicted transcriptional regulator
MIRTQIQLTEDQARVLKALAAKRKSSVAELIRQSVDNLIRETSEVDMAERRQRAIAAAGRFHSGQADISTHHDDYLTEAYQT